MCWPLLQVLIIVVVLSMALTPGLAQAGKVAGDWVDENLVPRPAAGTPLLAEREEGAAAGGHGTVRLCLTFDFDFDC
jgi:hypothetical protein